MLYGNREINQKTREGIVRKSIIHAFNKIKCLECGLLVNLFLYIFDFFKTIFENYSLVFIIQTVYITVNNLSIAQNLKILSVDEHFNSEEYYISYKIIKLFQTVEISIFFICKQYSYRRDNDNTDCINRHGKSAPSPWYTLTCLLANFTCLLANIACLLSNFAFNVLANHFKSFSSS